MLTELSLPIYIYLFNYSNSNIFFYWGEAWPSRADCLRRPEVGSETLRHRENIVNTQKRQWLSDICCSSSFNIVCLCDK